MPFSRSMQNAVLQSVLLQTCNSIISHHLWSSTEQIVTNNELYFQLSNATEYANNVTASKKLNTISASPNAINASSLNNSTSINGTSIILDSSETSFYKRTLPRDVIVIIVITTLTYYWQVWLERILPARPRPSTLVSEKSSPEDDHPGEEEVVKKWIAQGKIVRASLSLWNTALKWILDMTVGSLWIISLTYLLESLLNWKSGKLFNTNSLKLELGLQYLFSFASIRPLASLIAFVVIPAQKRIVFIAAMQLATHTFIGFFANTVIPWLMTTQFVKDVVGDMSAGIRNGTTVSPFEHPSNRLGDEL